MSDIVERLNRGEGCLEEGGKTCISMDAVSGCLCAIAADEITRLTAEMKRLRAALKQIAGMDPWDDGEQGYVDKARAALEGKQ
jgi:hypothetical protein